MEHTHTTTLILKTLNLKNFATFNDQTIFFADGFNSIIGETGSGKSLILDALQLILGSRSDRKIVRKNSEFATVEATFQCSDIELKHFFYELGFPFENDEIVIKRIIYSNGKSKNFLNFQVCTLQILQNFSKRFIDIVGQFENQKLLSPSYQLILIDHFANNQPLLKEYQASFCQLQNLKEKYQKLQDIKAVQAQRLDYINYQLGELEQIQPDIEDEKHLEYKKDQIINVEATKNLLSQVENIFEDENGINANLSRFENILKFSTLTTSQPHILDKLYQAKDFLTDIYYEITSINNVELDEEELSHVIDKLDRYQKLKRKFATDTKGLVELYQDFLIEKDNLLNSEFETKQLNDLIKVEEEKCFNFAQKLHSSRLKATEILSTNLTSIIQNLNMIGATIKINVHKNKNLDSRGFSTPIFSAETNPGEGHFAVKDIASGGELSRILLALRQVLSSKDSISIFFFDEIDSGIGGETALKIGKALKSVSFNSQVIAITHLPQIANFSDKLIIVKKEIYEKDHGDMRTQSTIFEADKNNMQEYIEKMTPLN